MFYRIGTTISRDTCILPRKKILPQSIQFPRDMGVEKFCTGLYSVFTYSWDNTLHKSVSNLLVSYPSTWFPDTNSKPLETKTTPMYQIRDSCHAFQRYGVVPWNDTLRKSLPTPVGCLYEESVDGRKETLREQCRHDRLFYVEFWGWCLSYLLGPGRRRPFGSDVTLTPVRRVPAEGEWSRTDPLVPGRGPWPLRRKTTRTLGVPQVAWGRVERERERPQFERQSGGERRESGG